MAENKMKKIAELFDLELDEEFKLSDGTNDKYKLTIDGVMQYTTWLERWIPANLPWTVFTGKLEIIKLPEKILTEEEKEYLSNVIKPFKDRIRCVIKSKDLPDEYLRIHLERYDDKKDGDIIYLPRFEAGTMYKGMQTNKKYTLAKLGL